MVSNFNLGRAGKIGLIWAFAIREVRKDKDSSPVGIAKDALVLSGAALSTAFILQPQIAYSGVGWGMRYAGTLALAAAQTPAGATTIAVTAIYAGGLAASQAIDPVSGVDNFVGFTSGGTYGEQDIHYLTGDANDSGYFNIPKNLSIIGKHYMPAIESNAERRIEDIKRSLLTKPSWAM